MRRTVPPIESSAQSPTGPPAPAVLSATATHCFIQVDGRRLHLLDLGGESRPVVFLHGVGGNAWLWLAVCRELAGTGRLLALDLRGYGESQWSADLAYATDDHVGDLDAVLNALEISEVDLVGFSWGGLIGLELAARSSRVRRLAMVDVPPSFAQSETDIPSLAYDFATVDDVIDAARKLSPRADESTLATVAALAVRPAEGGHLVKKHDAYFLLRWPFRSDDCWDALRSLRQPLLVVHATDSPVLSGEVAARMVAEARDARLVEIADCGHMVPIEQPAALAAALAEFLA